MKPWENFAFDRKTLGNKKKHSSVGTTAVLGADLLNYLHLV